MNQTTTFLRGVNLGGWLVSEPWITPSLYSGMDAIDEYTLSLSTEGAERLDRHHQEFITASDLQWIAARGLNAVRVPVGYWLFGNEPPFTNGNTRMQWLLGEAEQLGLRVIICIHGAPGSQNGYDHSGRKGAIGWAAPENVSKTLAFVQRLASEYGDYPSLYGIELLNEPSPRIGAQVLHSYYQQAYQLIRQHCRPSVRVIMSDAYQPLKWQYVLTGEEVTNGMVDTHLYQVFGKLERFKSINRHCAEAERSWPSLLIKMNTVMPVIVGEWSLALPERMRGLGSEAYRRYGLAQLKALEQAAGWFYWTYKTEGQGAWNFRYASDQGWLPESLQSA